LKGYALVTTFTALSADCEDLPRQLRVRDAEICGIWEQNRPGRARASH
jgi:hypothetical protein